MTAGDAAAADRRSTSQALSSRASEAGTGRSWRIRSTVASVMNSRFGRGQIRAMSNGAAQMQVNATDVVDLAVPAASLDQQRQIAERFEREWTRAGAQSAAINRQIALLQERRQALITAAVTGELDLAG